MTDYCIICETEPIEAKPQGMNFSWFKEVEGCECVCPWCIDDMNILKNPDGFVEWQKKCVCDFESNNNTHSLTCKEIFKKLLRDTKVKSGDTK